MKSTTSRSLAIVAGKLALGSTLALGFLTTPVIHAGPDTSTLSVDCAADKYAFEVGDDDCDGTIREDESGWDWATMGNGIHGSDAIDTSSAFVRHNQKGQPQ